MDHPLYFKTYFEFAIFLEAEYHYTTIGLLSASYSFLITGRLLEPNYHYTTIGLLSASYSFLIVGRLLKPNYHYTTIGLLSASYSFLVAGRRGCIHFLSWGWIPCGRKTICLIVSPCFIF